MNKTAFITGATSGFGEEISIAYARKGYNIIALGRRKNRLDNLENTIKSISSNVRVSKLCIDIREKKQIFDMISNIDDEFKNIEILVNNAGLALGQDKIQQANLDDFEVMIDTNIKGLLYVTKAILPIMIKNSKGYIFNIGSVAGAWPYPGGNVYGATKAFVKQFGFNLRNDLQGTNIRVTEIAPGIAKTEFSLVRFKGDVNKADNVYKNTKFLTPKDIATIIVNCSELPEHVNINSIEVMATTQTWAGFAFERDL